MRHYIILALLLLNVCTLNAQNDKVHISVAMPGSCTLDSNTKSILKNKLLNLVSAQGVAATECGGIIIVPEVDIVNSNTISGGMRRIMSVELGITVSIRNIITNTVFNSIQISAKGEGYSENDARRSAINKINALTPECTQFVETAKTKIADYYNKNAGAIITKANTLASQQRFDEAIALLSTCPESLPSYAQVSKAIASIFKKGQTQYCSQILMSAQAAYSRQDYEEAAGLLAMIDGTSSCAPQAQKLMNDIKRSMDKDRADQLALERDQMQSAERIRTTQIKAARDVATAYYKRQTNYVFFW